MWDSKPRDHSHNDGGTISRGNVPHFLRRCKDRPSISLHEVREAEISVWSITLPAYGLVGECCLIRRSLVQRLTIYTVLTVLSDFAEGPQPSRVQHVWDPAISARDCIASLQAFACYRGTAFTISCWCRQLGRFFSF